MVVDENNVMDCFRFYEEWKENERKINKDCCDANYNEFVDWCADNLYKCPNCDEIVLIEDQCHLNEPYNCDSVCDECIDANGYYE